MFISTVISVIEEPSQHDADPCHIPSLNVCFIKNEKRQLTISYINVSLKKRKQRSDVLLLEKLH